MSGSDHEDAEWLALLGAPLARQLPRLEALGLGRTGLLFLQNACENRCFFCSNPGTVHVDEDRLTRAADVDAWIASAAGTQLERVCVGGTEPMLHPHFDATLAGLHAAGLSPIELMTSGLRLAEPARARQLRAWGVRAVAVPLYAAEAALHDEVVGSPGAFDRTLRGLDAAHRAGIEVLVHTLALRRTSRALPALATLVGERWGSRLAIGPTRPKQGVWDWHADAATHAELAAAVRDLDVSLVAYPPCVAPGQARGAARVIDLYFRTTRMAHAAPCAGCSRRGSCAGVVAAELERSPQVVPF